MKKIKIPFSLEEYKKGGYELEDGHGRSVRIGFTDRKGKQPIVGLVNCKDGEVACNYSENGIYDIYGTHSDNDLVLIKYEFEDGDIVYSDNNYTSMISIFKGFRNNSDKAINIYVDVYTCRGEQWLTFNDWCDARNIRPATNEETQSLYSALATQKGLKWNAEIKDFEKIEKKIELKPKDFVLVRDDKNDTWELDIFGRITKDPWCEFTYICVSGSFAYCIPFNSETEHLLGKTEDCPDKYKQNNE